MTVTLETLCRIYYGKFLSELTEANVGLLLFGGSLHSRFRRARSHGATVILDVTYKCAEKAAGSV